MMRYKSLLRAPPWSSQVKWIRPARLVREYNESSTGLEAGESACPVCPRSTKTVRDTLATWGSSANHLPFESKSRFRGIQMSQGNNKRPNPPVREVSPNSLFSLTSLSTLKTSDRFQFSAGPPNGSDYVKQNVQKQQRSNFHSSSLKHSELTMAAERVNKTALHPGGVEYVLQTIPFLCQITAADNFSSPTGRGTSTLRSRRNFTIAHTLTTTAWLL